MYPCIFWRNHCNCRCRSNSRPAAGREEQGASAEAPAKFLVFAHHIGVGLVSLRPDYSMAQALGQGVLVSWCGHNKSGGALVPAYANPSAQCPQQVFLMHGWQPFKNVQPA
eukprot:1157435-Pelagomonas_calceolata.AAC.6